MLDLKQWAEPTFGTVRLPDLRRTRRAVQAATHLAANPLGSLLTQLERGKRPKSCIGCSLSQTPGVPLQDTTDLALSHRRKVSGVGLIGNERGRG